MPEWASAELGDVAELRMGQSPPGSLVSELRHGLPFLQGNAEFGVQSPQPRYQCDEAPRRAEPGDLLISVRAPVGAMNVADQECGIGRGLAAVRFTRLDERFGVLALQQAAGLLDRVCQGTTFTAIGRTELASLSLPVPPLEEQRRIAEILDTVDESIQATERLITKHELVMEAILATAALGYPGTEDRTLGIGDFCRLSAGRTAPRGVAEYYGGGVPWVKSGEVAGPAIRSTEETVTTTAVHDCGLRIIRSGTPLVAMYGATAGEVGWLDIDATTNQAVLAVEPDPLRANRRWLYWALRVSSARIVSSVQGSGQPNLSKQIIGGARLSLPDLEEQLAEVARIDSAQALIEAHRAEATKLQLFRVGLAADLLSGRVRTAAA